ncbi:MAG TPA: YbaK/EbsC family protein [Dehalococcoidia bacterium]|nr:YbaK/EbsC family protein [Dehalococcoidia bacterium]
MTADPAARVQAAIAKLHPDLCVEIHDGSTATADGAAAAAGCELGQIVKSLLFIAVERPVLALVAGDRKVDVSRLAVLLGVPRKRLRLATPNEVVEITGYAIGGVPPLGHPAPIETVVDASFTRYGELFAAAGTAHAVFRIPRPLLVELTGGRVAEFTT